MRVMVMMTMSLTVHEVKITKTSNIVKTNLCKLAALKRNNSCHPEQPPI